MNTAPASLYLNPPADLLSQPEKALGSALATYAAGEKAPILFRADDIGVPSANLFRMLDLFASSRVPLCLAVVPAWLTAARWQAIGTRIDTSAPLWCWHQHGWSHTDHQTAGKKCEFGDDRPIAAQARDLEKGRERLEALIGESFCRYFTPPWNRCSTATLAVLADLGFRGVSTGRGGPRQPSPLPDYHVNVDLHTRREQDGRAALAGLCQELRQAVAERYIGVMIHHQRLNGPAFELLERLLALVAASPRLAPGTFATIDARLCHCSTAAAAAGTTSQYH